jgi:hypothetical protein
MRRPASVLVATWLLTAVVVAGLAAVTASDLHPPDVLATPAGEVVPAPSDRDILRAAAQGLAPSVQRDPVTGGLVMVLAGRYDGRTIEQLAPAPSAFPAATPVLLAVSATALGTAAVGRWRGHARAGPTLAALAAGGLGATGVVGLLAGSPPGVMGAVSASLVLACAAVAAASAALAHG